MKQFKGKISIHRFTGAETGVSIELVDSTSRAVMFRVEMSCEEFGYAVTGSSMRECNYEPGRFELMGLISEHKTELIEYIPPFRRKSAADEADKLKAVAPFEVDGWKARLDDLGNHHRFDQSKNGYHVTFFRHVKPEEQEEGAK